jgi:hypothetical protein
MRCSLIWISRAIDRRCTAPICRCVFCSNASFSSCGRAFSDKPSGNHIRFRGARAVAEERFARRARLGRCRALLYGARYRVHVAVEPDVAQRALRTRHATRCTAFSRRSIDDAGERRCIGHIEPVSACRRSRSATRPSATANRRKRGTRQSKRYRPVDPDVRAAFAPLPLHRNLRR